MLEARQISWRRRLQGHMSYYNNLSIRCSSDPQLALLEHDEKQFYLARQHLSDLRNLYAIIMDLMHKNISKVRFPKKSHCHQ